MHTNVLIALLIITGLAAIIPVLSNRLGKLGIPIVVYEILAGIIIGGSGFKLIEPSPILTFLAEFGFAYLMFLSGLELDLDLLNPTRLTKSNQNKWIQALPIGIFIFLGTLLISFGTTTLLIPTGLTKNPLLLGLILSTTSLGVVVPVLKERELINKSYGQYLLVASSIADFASLILLTIFIAVLSSGLTLDLLLIPALLLIFILAARLSLRASRGSRLQQVLDNLSSATSQIRIRGAFALMVAWVVLAEAFGVEVILGAFLAGAIASLISGKQDETSKDKLDAIGYGFFIPIFFIMVGVRFNLQAVFASTAGLILLFWLIVIAFIVKIVPALLLRFQFNWRQSISGGMLLSSRLSLIIAASSIALGMGLISETVNSDIILLAIITCTVAPFLFNRIYPRDEQNTRKGIIIAGQDQLTEYLIEKLKPGNEPIYVICQDHSRVGALRNLGAGIVDRCDDFDHALEEAGAGQARVLIDLTANSDETREICQLGKQKYDIPLIVSRISDVDLIPDLKKLGIMVVQPELATAMALEGAIRYPTAFDVLIHQAEDIDVTEIRVSNPQFTGRRLGEIRLPGDVLILSLKRENTVMIPHGETVLQPNDRLGLIGSPHAIEEASARLAG